MKYSLPLFNKFKPVKLKKILEKIVKNTNKLKYDLTNEQLMIVVGKLYNREYLNSLESEILIFNFNKIIVLLNSQVEEFLNLLGKQLLRNKTNSDIYVKLIYDNIVSGYTLGYFYENIFKDIGKLLVFKNDIKNNISKYFLQNNNIIDFLKIVFFEFILDNNEWENFNNIYRISTDGRIYKEVVYYFFHNYIEQFLSKNIDLKLLELLNKNIVDLFERKEIYKKIFKYYRFQKIENYSYDWFKTIYSELGDPNKKIENWHGFNEVDIEMMKKWILNIKLEKVFSGKNGYDRKRLMFWKNYVEYLRDIQFIEELNRAIIMKTDNHIFIEFGETGNALFIYKKNEYSLNRLEIIEKIKNKSEKIKILKDLSLDKERLSHFSNWYHRFREELYYLGYKRL